jgi:hypothetical protein
MNPITIAGRTLHLGKAAPRHDPRTLRMARYMQALPPPPASTDWTGKMGPLGMMDNDRLGCCTCSAAGHLVQVWTGNAQASPVIIPDPDILAAYEGSCGYNPADPSTDQGGVEIDVLNYWRNTGVGGHKISAYASVNVQHSIEIQQAIALFGGIYIGVALPISAQSQVGGVWDVGTGPNGQAGSWGGHAVPVVGYSAADMTLTCITWGALQKMTFAFWQAYCDEAYACLSPDFIELSSLSPSGFDVAQLQADLTEITA